MVTPLTSVQNILSSNWLPNMNVSVSFGQRLLYLYSVSCARCT